MEYRQEDIGLIKKYLSGALSAREMYELERRAQQDPLLMDLMEGMVKEPLQTHETNLDTIDMLIKQRVQQYKSPRKLWPAWTAAASLLFAVLAIGFWIINKPQQEDLLASEIKPIIADTVAPTILSDTLSLVAAVPQSAPAPNIQKKKVPIERKQVASYAAKQATRPVRAKADTPAILSENLLAEASQGINLDTGVLMTGQTTNLAGTVVDEETKAPLAGAMVSVPNLNRATTTDVQGRFTLEIPKKDEQVEVSYLGYTRKKVGVAGQNSLQIAMSPDHTALEEVVVVGYDTQSKSNRIGATAVLAQKPDKNIRIRGVTSGAVDAAPIIGWEAYKAYLNKEAAVFDGDSGTVRLVFDLDVDGKPTDFRIKESDSRKLEERAIDIIKKGSAWKGGLNEVEVEISITFEKP